MTSAAILKEIEGLDFYKQFFDEEIYEDGRGLDEDRAYVIKTGLDSAAVGSAYVQYQGSTVSCKVIAKAGYTNKSQCLKFKLERSNCVPKINTCDGFLLGAVLMAVNSALLNTRLVELTSSVEETDDPVNRIRFIRRKNPFRANFDKMNSLKIETFLFYTGILVINRDEGEEFTIMSIVILIKNAVVFYVSSTPNIDDRLMEAFLFEHCPVTGALTNLLAGLSLAYGIYHFYNLHRHTKSHRYKASTLTEIYNIHEAQTVIHVFIPLLIAYFVLAMFCAFMIYLDIYLLFFGGCTVHSFLYRFFVNLVYISVATYTLFSTIFMLFRFSAIRKLLLADLFVATGYRVCAPTRVAPKQLDSEQVQKQYFAELQRVWDQ
ncbi:hypothetical protein M3Y96_00930000 [Aphelenchoides besseyi]|nr:hypothetical protein M3Y96_00930000 [Aphelenchoides besseyi]